MNKHASILFVVIASLGCVETKVDDADTIGSDATDSSGSDATGSTDSTSTGSTDSTSTDSTSTGSTSTDSGDPVMCLDVFPSFDKTCVDDSDCVAVLHTLSCCGTEVSLGISASETSAFESAEATCDSQYPECDCAPGPTLAEDGNEVVDPNVLAVACQMGACTSYVP